MASCKDCVHADMCRFYTEELAKAKGITLGKDIFEYFSSGDVCEGFKDRSQFVELPCKVGETVYMITQQTERVGRKKVTNNVIIEFCVDNFRIGDAGYPSAALCDNENNWCYGIMPEMFGTIVFFTREAAEQALKEREG